MDQLVQWVEVVLLIVLALLQLGRWSKTTEQSPANVARELEETKAALSKLRHEYNSHINVEAYRMDQTYARRDVLAEQLTNIRDKQEIDCDRITELEKKLERLAGV